MGPMRLFGLYQNAAFQLCMRELDYTYAHQTEMINMSLAGKENNMSCAPTWGKFYITIIWLHIKSI